MYEVEAALVGQRVTVRYDPSRPEAPVQVVRQGQAIEQARQADLYANCQVKRQRRTGALSTDDKASPPASGLAMRTLDDPTPDEGSTAGGQH